MAAHLDQDMGILSKQLGTGGAGVYTPSQYEYAMSPAPDVKGGKSRKAGRKSKKVSKSRKVRRTKRRRTAKKGVLRKAKSALLKMFRM